MIEILPWGEGDLDLLHACVGDPAMMAHLGGPESPEKIAKRQARYQQPGSRQYKIVELATGERAGWVGYWEREWLGQEVYEIGWAVIPAFQRRGFARRATELALALAATERQRRHVHAYPSVDNKPSNAVCRRIGFTLLGALDYEYPPGHPLRCNDWRYDLCVSARALGRGHES